MLVLLAALAGVTLLHVVGALAHPPLVPVEDVPDHEGARVAVEALVLDVRHGARGRYVVLADASARVPALAGPGDGPAPGDLVRAVGVVTRLDDGPGLSAESIDVLVPAASRPLSPADVARDPQRHEGARVLVHGVVRDGMLVGGGARLQLAGEPFPTHAREGDEAWSAAGTLRYHARTAAYVLAVDAWTRA